MERLNWRMLLKLAQSRPVGMVGPKGSRSFIPESACLSEVPAAPLWRFVPAALVAALSQAFRRRPDTVIAGSGLTAPMAWVAARMVGARYVVYLHGLDVVVRSRLFELLWLPAIRRCDLAVVNSRNTARLAIEQGVNPARIRVVHPGTELPLPDAEARHRFRTGHGLGNAPLLLSVGRLTARKGLARFVGEVLPLVLAQRPDTVLLVIGADAADAAVRARHSESARILESARRAGVAHALRWLPHCDDASLSTAYRAADVHVFPLLDVPGDVEGFGMVAIEAAAHGLPTVAYALGGVGDAIVQGVTGSLCSPGDAAAFAAAVIFWLEEPPDARAFCEAHAARFSWSQFEAGLEAALGITDEGHEYE